VEAYKSVQRHALDDLGGFSVLANNIHQQQIHQNIDLLNFANQLTFGKPYKVAGV
jgi:hypothetical protein